MTQYLWDKTVRLARSPYNVSWRGVMQLSTSVSWHNNPKFAPWPIREYHAYIYCIGLKCQTLVHFQYQFYFNTDVVLPLFFTVHCFLCYGIKMNANFISII